jgi:hypothetical protein
MQCMNLVCCPRGLDAPHRASTIRNIWLDLPSSRFFGTYNSEPKSMHSVYLGMCLLDVHADFQHLTSNWRERSFWGDQVGCWNIQLWMPMCEMHNAKQQPTLITARRTITHCSISMSEYIWRNHSQSTRNNQHQQTHNVSSCKWTRLDTHTI